MGRIAALVPEFTVKDLPLGRTLMIMSDNKLSRPTSFDIKYININIHLQYFNVSVQYNNNNNNHHHQSVLSKGRSYTENLGTKVTVLGVTVTNKNDIPDS